MSDGSIPDWLQRKHAAISEFEAEKQSQMLAKMTVRVEGASFWDQVCTRIKVVTENPPKGLWARFHHAPDSMNEQKDHCRIEIGYSCASPRFRYTDLWYELGGDFIQCRPMGEAESYLRLCVAEGKVRAINRSEPMSAEMVARFIAEPLIEYAMPAALAGVS